MRHPKRAIDRAIRTRRPKRPGRALAEQETERWPEGLRVKDIMVRPAVCVRPETTVGAAVETMRARRIRHAPVVNAAGRLVGIVTDRDLRPAVGGPAPGARAVQDVMTRAPITIAPEADLRRAAGCLHANRIGSLPVVEGGRVVGILTATDVIRALVRLLDEGVMSRPGRWGAEGAGP